MINKYMEQFAKDLEIDGTFATEVPGVFQIPIDEGVNVYVTEIPQGFLLKANIVECPKTGQGDFFAELMNANLLGKETHGNILALNEEGDTVILTRDVIHEVNYKDFSFILEDFFNQIDFWREETVTYGK